MTTGTDDAKRAFRPWVADGIPGSGANEPDKTEIRAAFDSIGLDIVAASAGGDPNAVRAVIEPIRDDALAAAGFPLRSDALSFAPRMATGETTSVRETDTGTHAAVAGEVRLDGTVAAVGELIPNEGRYTKQASGALWRTGSLDSQLSAQYADDARDAVTNLPIKPTEDDYALMIVDGKGEIAGFISKDGKQFNLSGAVQQWVSANQNRLRHTLSNEGVDLHSSGLVGIGGGLWKRSSSPSRLLDLVDQFGNLHLSLFVDDAKAKLSVAGLVARYNADGSSRLDTLDGTNIFTHEPGSDPVFNGASGGAARQGAYTAPNGEVLPLYADPLKVIGVGSSSIEYAETEFRTMITRFGAEYYNFGDGGARKSANGAQLGAVPALITVTGGSIPASGSVAVTVATPNGAFGGMDTFAGTLNGIPSTLGYASGGGFEIVRTTPGAVTAVAPGTPFIPDRGPPLRNARAILQIGKNDIALDTPINIGNFTHVLFQWFSAFSKEVIVMGHHCDLGHPEEQADINALNTILRNRYGPTGLFFDLKAWLASPQVWLDTGITPNQASLDAQAAGLLPAQLSRDGGGHLSDTAERALADKQLAPMMIALGWYKDPDA